MLGDLVFMSEPDTSITPVGDLLRLDGKVAVVTGAAKGIGRAIALRLAEAGAAVLATDIDPDALDAAIHELGEHCLSMQLDVGDPAQVNAVAERALHDLGRLDIWVNNAGIYPASAMDPTETSMSEFERVMHVNLTGTYLGVQACAHLMHDRGVIINIDSTAGFEGAGAYSASKWAVRGMTKGLAPMFGPRGIRVVAIAPTLIETPGIDELRESPAGELLADYVDQIPLGRVGLPDDIAKVALFLASDAAGFITGITVPVDGGALAG
jgi:NAD(P)-dependent dehydrogenase (short-subunit alcohol dehydrogenase family)